MFDSFSVLAGFIPSLRFAKRKGFSPELFDKAVNTDLHVLFKKMLYFFL